MTSQTELNDALCNACEAEQYPHALQWLQAGADPNHLFNQTSFFAAACFNTTNVNSPTIKTAAVRFIGQMLTYGANPNSSLPSDTTPLELFLNSLFFSSPLKEAVVTNLLEHGAHITSRILSNTHPETLSIRVQRLATHTHIMSPVSAEELVQQRYEKAALRWQFFTATTPPPVHTLSSRDLTLFANLGVLHDAIAPELWHGHEAHLASVLPACPPWIANEVLRLHPSLETAPTPLITDWSITPTPPKSKAIA